MPSLFIGPKKGGGAGGPSGGGGAVAAPRHILAVDDVGEELDDPIAIAKVLLPEAESGRIDLTLILSAGGIPCAKRLRLLNDYLDSVGIEQVSFGCLTRGNGTKLHVVRDDADELRSVLAGKKQIDAFVNNGPTASGVMQVIKENLEDGAISYLCGTDKNGKAKGVNQISTDKNTKEDWNRIFCEGGEFQGGYVVLLPEISRRIRFPNSDDIFPKGSLVRDIARRTLALFVSSRPAPWAHSAFPIVKRLNEANHFLCQEWLNEIGLKKEDLKNQDLAEAKIQEYLALCEGKGFDEEERAKIREVASLPLQVTYHYAEVVGYPEPYVEGKSGFRPENKNDANPGGAFVDDEFFEKFANALMGVFKTTTPTYDVTNSVLAVKGHVQELTEEEVDKYHGMTMAFL